MMKKYFDYLEELRRSGVTNMYGAYLQRRFPGLSCDPERASEILRAWMDSLRTKEGDSQ